MRSASARVSIGEDARAHVAIDATLRIDGGWLEALELDGLDPGLVLDPLDPVTMAPAPSTDGALASAGSTEPLEPRVTLGEDGVLVLAFTRRRAPRRGEYVVHLAYDADLSSRAVADEDGVHVLWTFPAWRHGLDSVRVELALPPQASPVIGPDDEIVVEQRTEAEHTVWTLTRAHLARTREWPIEIRAPEGVIAASRAAPPTPVPAPADGRALEAPRPPWQGGIALALASVLVAVRILRSPRREASERVVLRPLVPLPPVARALAALLLGAAWMGAALVGVRPEAHAVLAVALLAVGVSRGAPVPVAPKLGSFRHATLTIRRAARRATRWHRLGIDAWLDATTLPGLALLGALAATGAGLPVAALGPVSLALAIVVFLAVDGARALRPEPPLVALTRLVALAARSRVSLEGPALALMPVVHLDVGGVAQEARLRVIAAMPEGVLRTDVVIARRGVLGARYGLLVVVARGSEIDLALASDERFETVAAGSDRVARLTPIALSAIDRAVARVVEAGARCAPVDASPALTSAA